MLESDKKDASLPTNVKTAPILPRVEEAFDGVSGSQPVQTGFNQKSGGGGNLNQVKSERVLQSRDYGQYGQSYWSPSDLVGRNLAQYPMSSRVMEEPQSDPFLTGNMHQYWQRHQYG